MTTQYKGERVKDNFIFVDFLALDTSAIEFSPVKKNEYSGRMINIKYRGKILYVKFPKRSLPFGINIKTPLEMSGKNSGEEKAENAKGYDAAWSLNKEYSNPSHEDYAYYKKAEEIDDFFINAALKHKSEWLGMDEDEKEEFSMAKIRGNDKYGYKGLWKRLLKWSRNKESVDKKRSVNTDYPPRINAGFKVDFDKPERRDEETGRKKCKFLTKFFYEGNVPTEQVNESNYDRIVPKYSEISMLCKWSRLTASDTWIVLKSDIEQCVVYPKATLDMSQNYLDEDIDETESANLNENYLDMPAMSNIEEAIQNFDSEPTPAIRFKPRTKN